MTQVHISDISTSFQNPDFFWILIPIFFIGVITDKYQEEFGTSIGNAISNGALIIFTGFSWMQVISSRGLQYFDVALSQYLFAALVIGYGFAIIASGFGTGAFAQKYGRIRVITFMLLFFTLMIYVPILYNFISIIIFVLIFPLYYAFITWVIHSMPSAGKNTSIVRQHIIDPKNSESLKVVKKKSSQKN